MRSFLLSVCQIFQFQFWSHRRYCHVILGQLLRKYDVISIFQDNGRSRSVLLSVSYLLMSLPSEGQNLSTKPNFVDINGRHIYINLWLRYNDFWFGKTNIHHIVILFPVPISDFPIICILFCISLPNFVKIGAATAEIWRHIALSRLRPRPLKTISVFRICWFRFLHKVRVYEQTKFRRHISIDGWDITTSVFEKQTSAILEFYSRFRSRPLPVICMSFCITLPNFVHCRNMTSFPFF